MWANRWCISSMLAMTITTTPTATMRQHRLECRCVSTAFALFHKGDLLFFVRAFLLVVGVGDHIRGTACQDREQRRDFDPVHVAPPPLGRALLCYQTGPD